jgi:hypothetical protein
MFFFEITRKGDNRSIQIRLALSDVYYQLMSRHILWYTFTLESRFSVKEHWVMRVVPTDKLISFHAPRCKPEKWKASPSAAESTC